MVAATPSVVAIRIVDRVTVQRINTRPLTSDEILERGIVIGDDNFTAFRFSFGIETLSQGLPIELDVVFPQDDEVLEGGGPLGLPPMLSGLDTPSLDIQGLMLEREPVGFGVDIPPIPGVLLIPGNVAFLNEYFEVILLISNVAPAGSQLVINSATATPGLPLGDEGSPGSAEIPGDDPLRPAKTIDAPDGWTSAPILNRATGAPEFGPGEDAGGDFLLEGRRVGTHRVDMAIGATSAASGNDPDRARGRVEGQQGLAAL